jgi:hypothetical protein
MAAAAAAEHEYEHVPPLICCVTHIHRSAWDHEKGTLPFVLTHVHCQDRSLHEVCAQATRLDSCRLDA